MTTAYTLVTCPCCEGRLVSDYDQNLHVCLSCLLVFNSNGDIVRDLKLPDNRTAFMDDKTAVAIIMEIDRKERVGSNVE